MSVLQLIPLAKMNDRQVLSLLEMRNDRRIRQWMYSDHTITTEEHRAWVERMRDDPTEVIFGVATDDGALCGSVAVNHVDMRHRKADWAFYLSDNAPYGCAAAVEFALINFVFDRLDLEKLNCEVIAGNEAVVKLHKKFGFSEEGIRRENIIKAGHRVGVVLLGLTRDEWMKNKERIAAVHAALLRRFTVHLSALSDDTPLNP